MPERSDPGTALARLTLLELGFRPFFLLAGFAAVGLMLLWLTAWHETVPAARHFGPIHWHSHEMLFGYVIAVISGFLLTAVRNWTGQDTASGGRLAALALLWLAGRLLPWVPGVMPWLLAIVDLAFLPALALSLAGPLWAGANRVNRRFLWLLAAMSLANALIHAEALGLLDNTAAVGTRLMLDLVLLLLVWICGRILPFFVRAAIAGAAAPSRAWVESGAIVLLLALIAAHLIEAPGFVPGLLLLALAGLQGVRLRDWHHHAVWRNPILAVLFAGLGWLILALLLQALAEFGLLARSIAVHALTAGAFGVFTLGMMARVSLGHTGRPMQAPGLINLAFVLLNLAALSRVVGPWVMPGWYVSWVVLAGGLWSLAFTLFLIVYAPILLRPRADASRQ